MTIIFKCKTSEAYIIKILAELLANNIKTACLLIDTSGISLRQMDSGRKILIDLHLKATEFSVYKFNHLEKLYLGINLNHLHKMSKSIKKKDSIELSIDSENMTDLTIKVTPKENNKTTTSIIKIQNIQNLDITIPEGYNNHITVPSSDFSKMLKEMNNLGTSIEITAKNYSIEFSCNAGGILKRSVKFGENDEDVDEGDVFPPFDQEFSSEQLLRITKLAGLSANIQIFPGHPLLFKSNVGILGNLSIFIKSKEQKDYDDNCKMDSDDYSDIE